ncbi:MAG: hypothetical protein H0T93_10605 [Chloroflexia bacterium]|nr:hypothetical protein [Chloroflexia bacterium]
MEAYAGAILAGTAEYAGYVIARSIGSAWFATTRIQRGQVAYFPSF